MSDKRKENAENFFKKANLIFNNKFDYSLFNYINAKTKSTIICPIHGKFEQTPEKHVAPKSKGCPKCWDSVRGKTRSKKVSDEVLEKNKKKFLLKAEEKYKSKYKYDLSNYEGTKVNKIKIECPIHGWFESFPVVHLLKKSTGCNKCGRESAQKKMTHSYDELVVQLKKIHKNKYKYPSRNIEKYKNKKSIIEVECPEHGIFLKKAQKHIAGQGCFQCKIEELIEKNILTGGFCENLFNEKPELKNKKCCLYYLKINDGQFYKIGLTTCKVEDRIRAIKSKAKSFGEYLKIEKIKEKKMSLYECYSLEQIILKKNKKNRVYKKWSTEIFKNDIFNDIKKYF